MFKLLVSKTSLSLSIAFLLFGPGISVLTMGPLGSSGKNDCSPLCCTAAAAADAYVLGKALGAVLDVSRTLFIAMRARPALRSSEAMAGNCGCETQETGVEDKSSASAHLKSRNYLKESPTTAPAGFIQSNVEWTFIVICRSTINRCQPSQSQPELPRIAIRAFLLWKRECAVM